MGLRSQCLVSRSSQARRLQACVRGRSWKLTPRRPALVGYGWETRCPKFDSRIAEPLGIAKTWAVEPPSM